MLAFLNWIRMAKRSNWKAMQATSAFQDAKIDASFSRVRGSDLVVNLGTGRMGSMTHGVPGGHASSIHNIMAQPLAVDLAAAIGVDDTKALDLLKALGVVIQKRLLDGHPCGIPFVGMLAVWQHNPVPARVARKRAMLLDKIRYLRRLKSEGYKGTRKQTVDVAIAQAEKGLEGVNAIKRGVHLALSTAMARLFQQNATYYAHGRDCVRHEWEQQLRVRRGQKRTQTRPEASEYHLRSPIKAALLAAGAPLPHPAPRPNIPRESQHVDHLNAQRAAARRRYT